MMLDIDKVKFYKKMIFKEISDLKFKENSRSGVSENTKILMRNIDNRQGKITGREGYYTVNVINKEVLSDI